MYNEISMIRDNKLFSTAYAGLSGQDKVKDDAFYRHIRSRFLQQSARYLGADLTDSKVQSLCFPDVAPNDCKLI